MYVVWEFFAFLIKFFHTCVDDVFEAVVQVLVVDDVFEAVVQVLVVVCR